MEKYIRIKTLKNVDTKTSINKWDRVMQPNELDILSQKKVHKMASTKTNLISPSPFYQNA